MSFIDDRVKNTKRVMTDLETATTILKEEREKIERKCNEATGDTNTILCEVLSYFPEKAALFIKTQNYAFEITGRRSVWHNIYHSKTNKNEALDIKGFTGKEIQKVIEVISALRSNFDDYPDTEPVTKILHLISGPAANQNDMMIAYALRILQVTPEEIEKLKNFHNYETMRTDLQKEVTNLKKIVKDHETRIATCTKKMEQTFAKK